MSPKLSYFLSSTFSNVCTPCASKHVDLLSPKAQVVRYELHSSSVLSSHMHLSQSLALVIIRNTDKIFYPYLILQSVVLSWNKSHLPSKDPE